jgi:hypothetical protein
VFDEIPQPGKVLKRHQNRDDPCIMAWDHYKCIAATMFMVQIMLNRIQIKVHKLSHSENSTKE